MKKVVMVLFVLCTLFLISCDILPPTGKAFIPPNEIPSLFPQGGENQHCREEAPLCDDTLRCVEGICRSSFAVQELADDRVENPNQQLASGTYGEPCAKEVPRCEFSEVHGVLSCYEGRCWTAEEIITLMRSNVNKEPIDNVGRQSEEEKARRVACQRNFENYARSGSDGGENAKCQPECFKFGIGDPACCYERYCPLFEQLNYTSTAELEEQCRNNLALNIRCEEEVIQPEEEDICEEPNPEDIVEGGAVVTIIKNPEGEQIGRRIDFCHSNYRVRHLECYENQRSSSITPCPDGVECNGGVCGESPPIDICVDTDPNNDEFEAGLHMYRDDYSYDRCQNQIPQGLIQMSCNDPDLIECWNNNECNFATPDAPMRCDAWCEEGRCVVPEDFEEEIEEAEEEHGRDFEIEEFDPRNTHFLCEDSDGGINPQEGGQAEVYVSYSILGFEVIRHPIRRERDNCGSVPGPGDSSCNSLNIIHEAYCDENGIPATQEIECPQGTSCIYGECVEAAEIICADTDGGNVPEVYGVVTQDLNEDIRSLSRDRCNNWGCTEYFCHESMVCRARYDKPEEIAFDEPYLLRDLEDQEGEDIGDIPMFSTCFDYDFGDRPFFGAYSTAMQNGLIVSESDQCINENTLRETVCVNGEIRFIEHQCELGCDDRIDEDGNVARDGYHRCRVCIDDQACHEQGAQWCNQWENQCEGEFDPNAPEEEIAIEENHNDLSNYPGFFVRNGTLQVSFVIGQNAPVTDNLAAIDLALSITNWGGNNLCAGNPNCNQVVINTILDSEVEANQRNYFAIGAICDNTFIQAIDNALPGACEEGGEAIENIYAELAGDAILLATGGEDISHLFLIAEEAGCRRSAAQILANGEIELPEDDGVMIECN